MPSMTKAHRLGFYHTFLATKSEPTINEHDEWEGVQVYHDDTPIFGLEVFVEYRLFDEHTHKEILFDDEEYLPLHHYIDVAITRAGLVFSPNETLLDLDGYTLDYKPTEYYTVVNDAHTFTSGPYAGMTVQMPKPKMIDRKTFDAIVSDHLACFLNADKEPGQSMAYNRVEVKG